MWHDLHQTELLCSMWLLGMGWLFIQTFPSICVLNHTMVPTEFASKQETFDNQGSQYLVRFNTGVRLDVNAEVFSTTESLSTQIALVRFDSGVNNAVPRQMRKSTEWLVADAARKLTTAGVLLGVKHQRCTATHTQNGLQLGLIDGTLYYNFCA